MIGRLLCRAGFHRFHVTQTRSVRYGVLVTRECVRSDCPVLITEVNLP